MQRQATPLLVQDSSVSQAEPLARIELRKGGPYNERWVQELIHSCPSVLPISSLEAAFWPASPVCTELALRSGFLDNLLVTPLGNLIAVECKLWRNPEARREVVAQIIDYAKDLQSLSYDDLLKAIKIARKDPSFSLFAHAWSAANEPEAPIDEAQFTDAVSRNLRLGRCLLIIVGDGITENVEAMTEFLQQHAGIHFALGLVQLAVHELPGSSQRIIVPSVPMRTINIVRGIVHIDDNRVTIVAPAATPRGERASTLTDDEMFAALDRLRPGTSNRLIAFLKSCEDLQVTWEVKKTLIVRMVVGEFKILPFVINSNGTVDTGYTFGQKEAFRKFAEALEQAIPGTKARETPKTWLVKKSNGDFITVWELLDNASECRAALEALNRSLRDVSDLVV